MTDKLIAGRIGRAALVVGAVVVLSAGVALAAAYALHAASFEPKGCAQIEGWHWLRTDKASVTYTFDMDKLAGCNTDKVHINFAGLATNGVNGGAGYDAKAMLIVRAGQEEAKVQIWAQNAFAPRSPEHSKGLGYAVQGFTEALPDKLVEKAIKAGTMTVTLEWKNVLHEHHVAVNKSSVSLGYLKGEKLTPGHPESPRGGR